MINITIENLQGIKQTLQVPTDMNLSLMETLKAAEYDVEATCGGMALCGSCHIEVLSDEIRLPEIAESEQFMLDELPNSTKNSRLACQLRVTDELDGLTLRIKA